MKKRRSSSGYISSERGRNICRNNLTGETCLMIHNRDKKVQRLIFVNQEGKEQVAVIAIEEHRHEPEEETSE